MKINKLDYAKVVSDFMFIWEDNPEEKAGVIFKLKHRLTPHWLEKYMQYYFEKKKWYKATLVWNTGDLDWWIDLKWITKLEGKREYMVAQCKKYSIKDVSEDLVRNFLWSIAYTCSEHLKETTGYFITTSKFTQRAKEYGESFWIKLIDFYSLYKLQKFYSIEEFEVDIKKDEGEKTYNKCFNKDQLMIHLEKQRYDSAFANESDIFQFLKQVRRDYSYQNQLRLWDIARNDTLELIAKSRPHNLDALKKVTESLPQREKNKINKHWSIFVERLKYISQEEKAIEETTPVLDRLVNFMRGLK